MPKKRRSIWNDKNIQMIKDAYTNAKTNEDINLEKLSYELCMNKQCISRKAKELGLTNNSREKKAVKKFRKPMFDNAEDRAKYKSDSMKNWHKTNEHPKGMLGKNHTNDSLIKISLASANNWESYSEDKKVEMIHKARKSREQNGNAQNMNRANASWGAAWREIGGTRKYYRSKWEANYARYLQWLLEKGEIKEWKHEPETFWFEGIKRGCLSYLPDFRVVENNGSVVYHEVKGWMDDRSKTKIKRMAKYHPNVKLIVIDAKGYASLKKTIQPFIKDWETDAKGR